MYLTLGYQEQWFSGKQNVCMCVCVFCGRKREKDVCLFVCMYVYIIWLWEVEMHKTGMCVCVFVCVYVLKWMPSEKKGRAYIVGGKQQQKEILKKESKKGTEKQNCFENLPTHMILLFNIKLYIYVYA